MNATDKINIYSLHEEARKSEDNEAFRILGKIGNCRIGIGARLESSEDSTFFVEVLVNLCTGQDPVDLDLVERKLTLLRKLRQRKYVLNCQEDGCVSCELTVQSENLVTEYETTRSMMEKSMKTRNRQSRGNQSGGDRDGGDKP